MTGVVLVLNQDYEPLNVTNLPRAFRLVFGAKAEVLEYDHPIIRTVRQDFHAPSVIRLQHQVKRPRPRVKLTRREVFARDRHTCQYCGRQASDLTLAHILPRPRRRPGPAVAAAPTPGTTSSPLASRATTARAAGRPKRPGSGCCACRSS